jgi:DNA repair exonuclease SbcCD ATPase subunit
MRALIGAMSAVVLMFSVPLAAQKSGQTIQCWTTKEGTRMCGDRVPPEYADQQRQVIDEQGRVIETKERARTPEERAAEEAEARRRAEAEEAEQRAAEYDRHLLQTYRSVRDLQTMRNERLELLAGRMRAAERSLADNEASLKDLRARAEAQESAGKPVADRLKEQIRQYERSLKENQSALERLGREREEVETRFNRDIQRFSELRGEPVPSPPPPAARAEEKPGG